MGHLSYIGSEEAVQVMANLLISSEDKKKINLAEKINSGVKKPNKKSKDTGEYIFVFDNITKEDCKMMVGVCAFIFLNATKFPSDLIQNFGVFNIICCFELFDKSEHFDLKNSPEEDVENTDERVLH